MIEIGRCVAPELIDCIADARYPTAQELGRLADRVAREIGGAQPAFAWDRPAVDATLRVRSYRIAHAAPVGSDFGYGKTGNRVGRLAASDAISA